MKRYYGLGDDSKVIITGGSYTGFMSEAVH